MTDSDSLGGFRSEAAKRGMTIWAWTLGIPVGIVQLVIPVASFVWLIVAAFAAAFSAPSVQVNRAVVHQEEIWLPRADSDEHPSGEKGRHWAVACVGRAPRSVALPLELSGALAPWLVPDGEDLLVFRAEKRGVIRGDKVDQTPDGSRFDPESRLFMMRGNPSALERDDRSLNIKSWSSGAWNDAGSAGLELPESTYPDDMVVVMEGATLHAFMQDSEGSILHGESRSEDRKGAFRKVSTSDGGFAAGLVGETLYLVRVLDKEDGDRIEVLRRVGDDFKPSTHVELDGADDVQWVTLDGKSTLVAETSMGGVQLITFDGEKLVRGESTGSGFSKVLLWALMPYGGSLVLAALYAGIIALLMRSRRVEGVHGRAEGTVRLASLGRRSLARGIDTVLTLIPIASALTWALLDGQPSSFQAVSTTGAQMGYAAWALLLTGVFSATEGHLGTTPGKALLGIRVVGIDLQPCGFGRGLARNLLLAIDGLLMYQVGIMTIALSENQQRLGDLASKTLVIRKGGGAFAEGPPKKGLVHEG